MRLTLVRIMATNLSANQAIISFVVILVILRVENITVISKIQDQKTKQNFHKYNNRTGTVNSSCKRPLLRDVFIYAARLQCAA